MSQYALAILVYFALLLCVTGENIVKTVPIFRKLFSEECFLCFYHIYCSMRRYLNCLYQVAGGAVYQSCDCTHVEGERRCS